MPLKTCPTVQLTDRPDGHWYETPVGIVPSVSTILRGRQATPFSETAIAAMNRGTQVHQIAATYLSQTPRSLPDDVAPELLTYWRSLLWTYGFLEQVEAVECSVYHPDGYAGTIDAVVQRNGQRTLVELTTTANQWYRASTGLKRKAPQAIAYRQCWDYCFPESPIEAILIVIAISGKRSLELTLDDASQAIATQSWEAAWNNWQTSQ
jgi:hypothetical protein